MNSDRITYHELAPMISSLRLASSHPLRCTSLTPIHLVCRVRIFHMLAICSALIDHNNKSRRQLTTQKRRWARQKSCGRDSTQNTTWQKTEVITKSALSVVLIKRPTIKVCIPTVNEGHSCMRVGRGRTNSGGRDSGRSRRMPRERKCEANNKEWKKPVVQAQHDEAAHHAVGRRRCRRATKRSWRKRRE